MEPPKWITDRDNAEGEGLKWFNTRPECVQKLCHKFSPGEIVVVHGIVHYLVGFTETDELVVSCIDPSKDFDGATSNIEYVPADEVKLFSTSN